MNTRGYALVDRLKSAVKRSTVYDDIELRFTLNDGTIASANMSKEVTEVVLKLFDVYYDHEHANFVDCTDFVRKICNQLHSYVFEEVENNMIHEDESTVKVNIKKISRNAVIT